MWEKKLLFVVGIEEREMSTLPQVDELWLTCLWGVKVDEPYLAGKVLSQ